MNKIVDALAKQTAFTICLRAPWCFPKEFATEVANKEDSHKSPFAILVRN